MKERIGEMVDILLSGMRMCSTRTTWDMGPRK